jgi:tetratricopeptide (TPR) repeat protein
MLAAARARFDAGAGDEAELIAARDALLEVGDTAGAARAETLAARVAWTEGRGEDVLAHARRAEELAAQLPTSEAKAGVYSILARLHWLGNREEPARRLLDEALEMADELGLAATRATLLSMLGTVRASAGDPGGLAALEESIAIYEELGSPDAQSPYNNLADTLYRLGRIREAGEATARMTAAQKRFPGIVEWVRWNDSQELRIQYANGSWDRALELADRQLADLEAGSRHYLEPEWRIFRARIRFARGDLTGSAADAQAAVDFSRAAGDAQLLIPSLAVRARSLAASGRPDAESIATELVDTCRRAPPEIVSDWFPEASIALAALGRAADVDAIAETAPTPTPWRDAGLALAHGKPTEAAEIFAAMGALPYEAEARLRAATTGADAGLDDAVDFFRRVGATAFLREAEALLRASA